MRRPLIFITATLALVACEQAAEPITTDLPHAAMLQVAGDQANLTNGDFEDGDLSLGWTYDGTQNYSVERVELDGNHIATVAVGEGPVGDASCTNPYFSNFAYLDQFFTLPKDHVVQLDFLVPVPGALDPTENAPCSEFDRIEIDLQIVELDPYQMKALGVLLVDNTGSGIEWGIRGALISYDFVRDVRDYAEFDPAAFTRTDLGALVLQESSQLPGWLKMSMEVSSDYFPWVSDEVTFRVTVRNEDNGFTGRHFSISVDNVLAIPIARSVTIDVRPGSFPNSINLGSNGTIPVAILSTADFNAMTVDAASVTLAGAEVVVKGNGTPMATAEDVNADGLLDLVVHVFTSGLALAAGDVEAVLEGETYDGIAIRGSDGVRIVP